MECVWLEVTGAVGTGVLKGGCLGVVRLGGEEHAYQFPTSRIIRAQ